MEIKLTQKEYDFLDTRANSWACEDAFKSDSSLMEMKEKGLFKEVDVNMTFGDIFNNSLIIEE